MTVQSWHSIERPVSYLYRAVFNESNSFLRKAQTLKKYLPIVSTPNTVAAHDDRSATQLAVQAAMETLTAKQKAIVFLTYWEDRTPVEVADLLGVSEGTVKKQLARSREKLRKESLR